MAIIKTFDERKKHIIEKNRDLNYNIVCDTGSLAGAISQRACVYSGARVVLNPLTDAVHLVHGPIGCASYTWDIRGALTSGADTYRNSFSTDIGEKEVIFGGGEKLMSAIREITELYSPPAIFVYATCIIGIIGDDIRGICKKASEELKIPIIPVQSEGFKMEGKKSDGYKAACDAIFELIDKYGNPKTSRDSRGINILGDFNVAGDLWVIKNYLNEMGVKVISSITGDGRINDILNARNASLNIVQCAGSMTYLAKLMKHAYDIPFIKVQFFGIGDTSASLMNIAEFFNDPNMIRTTKRLIERETKRVMPELDYYRNKLKGKRAAIYMGGPAKAMSLINAFRELDMEVVIVGTQTGKKEDYAQIKDMVNEGTVIVDDANPSELKGLMMKKNADLLVAGVKERYMCYKLGIGFCDFNHDRKEFFEGFEGMLNFAKEIYNSINSPVWKYVREYKRECL